VESAVAAKQYFHLDGQDGSSKGCCSVNGVTGYKE
jgi:hypothetical protein